MRWQQQQQQGKWQMSITNWMKLNDGPQTGQPPLAWSRKKVTVDPSMGLPPSNAAWIRYRRHTLSRSSYAAGPNKPKPENWKALQSKRWLAYVCTCLSRFTCSTVAKAEAASLQPPTPERCQIGPHNNGDHHANHTRECQRGRWAQM